MAGQVANLESAVEQLEDAVAIVNARGELLFANPAMRTLLPDAAPGASLDAMLPRRSSAAAAVRGDAASAGSRAGRCRRRSATSGERLVMTHAINDPKGDLVGVMLIARNLEYLSEVQSTMRYSRKLAALGRLSAGVAHEVKNPLNAMMIHLELLRQQVAPVRLRRIGRRRRGRPSRRAAGHGSTAEALQHVDVIAHEIRRLDEVVQGFLKFTPPRGSEAAAARAARRCSTRSCRSCGPRPSAPASS